MATTWRVRCGIADYAARFMRAVGDRAQFHVVPIERRSLRPRDILAIRRERASQRQLAQIVNRSEICHIQYSVSFWNSTDPITNTFPAFISRVRVPVVMTIHELGEVGHGIRRRQGALGVKDDLRRALTRLLARGQRPDDIPNLAAFRRADALFVHNSRQREALAASGVAPGSVILEPHPVPCLPEPAASPRETRERYGIREGLLVAGVGFINPRKRYEMLVEALERMGLPVQVIFAGEADSPEAESYRMRLERRIASGPLAGRAVFTGYLSERELSEVLQIVDLVVAPYRDVSGSGSAALALSRGVPVLASDCPPMRMVSGEDGGVCLFREDSPEELARSLGALLLDAGRRESMRLAARRYAAAHSFERSAEAVCSLYERCLAGGLKDPIGGKRVADSN